MGSAERRVRDHLPLGLQILRVAAPVAHAMDYTSTVQGLGRGLHEQAPLVGPIAYHPRVFALYKAGVAWASDRAVVGLYRAEDQRRRWWALGMRPREWAWALAGASVAVPAAASALNWRQ